MEKVKVFGKNSASEWINFILRTVWIFTFTIFGTAVVVHLLLFFMEGSESVLIKLSDYTNGKITTQHDVLIYTIKMITYLVVVWGLKKLFNNLEKEKIFIKENVFSIRIIALALFSKAFISENIFEGIFLAAVIFILGEIFKVGDNLKKEVESIV